jgi:hypothetical protein
LLFVCLAIPIAIIPDFIPVLGYADDAVIVVLFCAVCAAPRKEPKRQLGVPIGAFSVKSRTWTSAWRRMVSAYVECPRISSCSRACCRLPPQRRERWIGGGAWPRGWLNLLGLAGP